MADEVLATWRDPQRHEAVQLEEPCTGCSWPVDVPLYPERPDGLPATERWLNGRREVWTGSSWVTPASR